MVTNDPDCGLTHPSTPLSAITVVTAFPIYSSQRPELPVIMAKGGGRFIQTARFKNTTS